MAFDKTLPTDSSKIRKLGEEIRPNWVAIEQAETTFVPIALNLKDRTEAGTVPEAAAQIDDAVVVYAKQDADTDVQLYATAKDNLGAVWIKQLTSGTAAIINPGLGGANDYGIKTPFGITICWGNYNPGGASEPIAFAIAFKAATTPGITLAGGSPKYAMFQTLTENGFTVVGSAATFSGSYIAVGQSA